MEKTLIVVGLILLQLILINLIIAGSIYNLNYQLETNLISQFDHYQSNFNKKYFGSEYLYRLQVYQFNLADIQTRNSKYGTKIFGETQFTDLTDEEFNSIYLTLKLEPSNQEVQRFEFNIVNSTPIDWRSRGAVTPVKNQGQCGSCWAFSTTGVLEGFFKVTTDQLPDLSEQQLVDCSTIFDYNKGCDGGAPIRALNYVKRNGITTQAAYPYIAEQNKNCQIKGGVYHISVTVSIFANEAAHQAALQEGPISVAVQASDWKNYKPTGDDYIFPSSACTGDINHAVLAVGFTSDALIIKNSWATSWGVDGYIYLQGGVNTCSVWNNSIVPK